MRKTVGNMIQALGDLVNDDHDFNEFDRSFIESAVERTGNGKAPTMLEESEVTKVEILHKEHC